MSDFGAIVYIKKANGESFEEAEVKQIETICTSLASEINLTGSMGKPYLFNVGTTRRASDGVVSGVNLLLSDYWGDTTDFKWHEEVDLKDCRVIAGRLKENLPPGLEAEGVFEWW